jgi:predicted dehydrogenase
MHSNKIRWGILGCGKIANKFAADLALVDGAELRAVASRDLQKAKTFASQHGAKLTYTSYQELATSEEVDVIYVATPHGLHHTHVMLCLQHKKAVLCEKAFALNAKQAKEMLSFAKQQDVFLMEAFWTKFLPQYQLMMKMIEVGDLGDIKMIQADFGFKAATPPPQRLYDPALGGGSLLDIGIYPVFLALSILGRPIEVQANMQAYSTGLDEQCAVSLTFENGAMASLYSTFAADTPVAAVISGTKARLHITNRFHNVTSYMELQKKNEASQVLNFHKEDGLGYQYEARHVCECLRLGLTESPVMKHSDTLLLMETLDRIRKACGIVYPADA